MTQTILLKRSETPGSIPTTGDLLLGEAAINTYDGRLFFVKNNGTATLVEVVTTENFNLNGLTDVTITDPTINNVLIHNGTDWENNKLNLYQLGDVLIGDYGPPVDPNDSTLVYNSVNSVWFATPIGTDMVDATGVANNYYISLSEFTTSKVREFSTANGFTFNPNTGIVSATGFSGSGANLTSISASNISGTLPSSVLGASSVYIGTTAVALNRPSGSLLLNGVSIDGSSAKSTNLIGGNSTTLLGSIGYQSNTDITTLLSPNVTATKKFLTQTGTGTNGSAPGWNTISMSDLGTGTANNTTYLRGDGTWQIVTTGIPVTNDTTTNSTLYVPFTSASTGSISGLSVSSSKFTVNPSTGNFTVAGTITGNSFNGSGAQLTGLPAAQLTGTIPSTVLQNSSVYIGTTAVALNRPSGALSLAGVSIDGSAGSATTATTATKATNLVGGNNTTLLGSIGYQSNTDTTTLLSPNTTTTKKFLTETGTGTNGAAPAWNTISPSDLGTGTANSTTFLRGDSTWQVISNATNITLADDVSTNITYYPTFATATSGSVSSLSVSSSKLTYNPNTGVLTASGFSGNASTATALQTARTINGVSFNGTANITIADSTKLPLSGGTMTGAIIGSLTGNASTATALQTARNINGVAFDGTANITISDSTKLPLSGGTMTGAIIGSLTGNASTSTALQTARNINGVAFDGTANITISDSSKLPLTGGSMTGSITIPTGQVITLTDQPTVPTSAANKAYVDARVAGLTWKTSVLVSTTIASGNITLSGGAPNTLDGITLSVNDRILVKNQTTTSQNGIYEVTTVGTGTNGTWTRATDMDALSPIDEINSAAVFVEQGTHQDTGWTVTSNVSLLGTDAITWTQFTGASAITQGTGISISGNTLSLATLADSGTGSFLKITRDTYGRVSGTTAVSQSDITGLLGAGSISNSMIANGAVANLSGINSGDQTITLTGDVTGTGTGSFATTLASITQGVGSNFVKISIDTKGRIIGNSAVTSSDITSTIAANTYQPYDADLATIAGLSGVSGFLKTNGSGSWFVDTTSYLTAATDTLATVTARGSTTSSAITITNATSSSNTTSGALIVTGGVGISGTIHSGQVYCNGVSSSGPIDSPLHRQTTGTLTTTDTTEVEIPLTLSSLVYRTVEYLIQITSGTNYHSGKVLVTHDGTNTWIAEYATIITNVELATFSADIVANTIRLLVTPTSNTTTTFNVVAQAIRL